jgi:hypothetical protein
MAATGLDGFDNGLGLVCSILGSGLSQCHDSIETRVELNLNLAQGVLAHFIETDQRALGADEVTNGDNCHDDKDNKY